MKKIPVLFNFRILFVLAVYALLSVTAAYDLIFNKGIWFGIYLGIAALTTAVLFLYFKRFNRFSSIALCAVILLLFFTATTYMTVKNFSPKTFSGEIKISGKTTDIIKTDGDSVSVLLERISFEGKSSAGKLELRLTGKDADNYKDLPAGIIINFSATPQNTKLIKSNNRFDSRSFKNNIKYFADVKSENILSVDVSKPQFISGLREKIKKILYSNLSDKTAGVAYSMFTGDTSDIDISAVSDLRAAGLAHILAVSGLHVMFVYAALGALLKKFRIGKIPKLVIVSLVLLLYTFVCGFSASVIRAAIMCVIMMLAKILYRRYDLLSAMSLAALLIITFAPLYIYDIGFQFSFAAMAGIACLSGRLSRLIKKVLRSEKISGAAAMTISAQIGTMPLVFSYFGVFSVYSVLSNIIVTFVLGISFQLLMAGLIPALIISGLGVLLKVFSFPLTAIIWLSDMIARLPFSEVLVFAAPALIIACVLLLICSGKFLILEKKPKIISAAVSAAIFLIFAVITNIEVKPNNFNVYLAEIPYSATAVVADGDNKRILVTDFNNAYDIREYLTDLHIRRIDSVIITGKLEKADELDTLVKHFGIEKVYIPKVTGTPSEVYVRAYTEAVTIYQKIELDGINIRMLANNNKYYGTYISRGESSVLMIESVSRESIDFMEFVGITRTDFLVGRITEEISHDYFFEMLRECNTNYNQLRHNRYFTYKL